MTKFDQLTEVIKRRRSIFPASYTGEKLSDDIIISILENANWAPSHRKTEPWRFIIFKEGGLQSLSNYLASYYEKNTPTDKFSELKLKKTKQKALQSSHVIAICMQRDPEERVPEWEELAAVSMAVQNMWLSCSALDLGCYWSSPKSMIEASDFLELRDGESCLGIFYIGVPKEGVQLSSSRNPLSDKLRWIS